LSGAGYRRGGARRAVVELLGRQDCCLSAHEIFDELRRARRPVGIASVYRALEALVDLRLVKRVDAGDGIARYEAAPADGNHHHHLVCRDCGKVEAFSDSRLERAIDRVAGGLGYSVDEHEVVLMGACADCS
jgi:Fur family ferric uptake transcriptional regulator